MNYAIIFDLDGTLIDTPRGIVESFIATLKSMGVGEVDPLAVKATIGLPLEKAFAGLLNTTLNDEQVGHAVKTYQALFKDIVLPKAKELIFPGVTEGLIELQNQGLTLAIATSKVYRSAKALLTAAGLLDYFQLVLGADQVSQPKPHPEIGLLALKALGTTADNSVMVGDTTHDIIMARDARMRSIAVTYGVHDAQKLESAEPTWVVDTFDEVVLCIQSKLLTEEVLLKNGTNN